MNTYAYDARGRLSSVTVGGVTTTYGVNGLGQRVTKSGIGVLPNGTELYVYDESGHLLGEYDGTGAAIQETVWLGDLPVAILTGSEVGAAAYYIHPDHLGAPKVIMDQSGVTVWSWEHDPFGNGQPTGTFSYNLRFPGQYYDAESGLSYNYYRDYDPALGRYVQSDPIGLKGGVNTYGYVGSNPLWASDPLGLLSWLERRAAAASGAVDSTRKILGNVCGDKLSSDQKDDLVDSILQTIDREDAMKFAKINPNNVPLILSQQQESILRNQVDQINDLALKQSAQDALGSAISNGRVVVK